MNNEHCWILVGKVKEDLWWAKKRKMTSGTPCSVAFDAGYVMQREELRHDIIGWVHLHPGMIASPSMRDDDTMHAWCLSLGKPLICCILGIDGLRAWWYKNDESQPEEFQVEQVGNYLFGLTPCNSEKIEEHESHERYSLKYSIENTKRELERRKDWKEGNDEPPPYTIGKYGCEEQMQQLEECLAELEKQLKELEDK